MLLKTGYRSFRPPRVIVMRAYSSKACELAKILESTSSSPEFKAAKKKSREEIMRKLHLDPEPGSSWSACQVTALSSMIDLDPKEPSEGLIARYLLDVEEDGTSPLPETIVNRLKNLGLPAPGSKAQAKKLIKPLQQWLRQNMAAQIGIELAQAQGSGEWCIKDRPAAFERVLDTLEARRCKIGLAIYPGTPTLTEVRSFVGATYIVPFKFNEQRKCQLDTCGEYLQIAGTRNWVKKGECHSIDPHGTLEMNSIKEQEYQEAKSTGFNKNGEPIICHIPTLNIAEGEALYVLHVGFAMQNESKLDPGHGNIVSKLGLDNLDPLAFMRERYGMLNKKSDEAQLEELLFPHLSLFHFSHMPSFSKQGLLKHRIKVPENSAPYQDEHEPFIPINSLHHPVLFFRSSTDWSLKLSKAEDGIRTTLTLLNELNLADGFAFKTEKYENGIYVEITDDIVRTNNILKFIKNLQKYHEINFCLQTRQELNNLGLTPAWLEHLHRGIKL